MTLTFPNVKYDFWYFLKNFLFIYLFIFYIQSVGVSIQILL